MKTARKILAAVVAATVVTLVTQATTAEAGGLLRRTPSFGSSYMVPQPVPAWVGHTYYNYQGLYPHNYMYPHYDVWTRKNGGLLPSNTTRILYW